MIIGIHGRARNGKDTVGEHLRARYGFTTFAFAEPLWDGILAMFRLDRCWLQHKDDVIPHLGFFLREAAQRIGTDTVRQQLGIDTWIHVMRSRPWPAGNVVVLDVRFENEAQWVRALGGEIWHVVRPDAPTVRDHTSEHGFEARDGEPLIENDQSVDELRRLVDGLMAERVS